MNYSDIDASLARAEGDLAIARELAGNRRNAKALGQLLAGVVGNIENVRLHIGRTARIKHCPKHEDYEDSCHDCYMLQYGRMRNNG